eukprot:TRINITY_DN93506_c0_g1_i1.p1 TRINITY_DN93506_c0_g1~~TRINITY_DN93506_c0_g1_i1.p1  ORF type:complete len:275 (-),score=59.75 TRINITY_DN93506_c0_g1_i1:25-849(-)
MQQQALFTGLALCLATCVWGLTPKGTHSKSDVLLKDDTGGQRHALRICNAYTSNSPLEVSIDKKMLTAEVPIPYKACREMKSRLRPGDDIEFTFFNGSKGVFELTDLPAKSSILLLVVYRDIQEGSDSVAFHSHIFASVPGNTSQILALDSFNGPQKSQMLIAHQQAADNLGKADQEKLQYSEVVMVDGGNYKLELLDDKSKVQHSLDFAALDGESYVALRIGGLTARTSGETFLEELLVFPKSKPLSQARSSARAAKGLGLAAALLVAASLQF